MSLATVYKTLNLLKELGEAMELGFRDDDERYESKRPQPHPHLICIRCWAIIDPEVEMAQHLMQQVAQRILLAGYGSDSERSKPIC
jgi:Fur family transcriptional regulator, peroxide stress response regulator